MAYQSIPRVTTERPGSRAAEDAIRALLTDLAGRKEFCIGRVPAAPPPPALAGRVPGFGGSAAHLFLPGLRLHGAQLFVRNFENPDTEYTRLLVNWQTGTGKSNAAASMAHEFIRSFRARAAIGETPPLVTVISFTARETIQAELLRNPEYGFVSQTEVEELRRLRLAAGAAGPGSVEDRQHSGFVGILRRRITDRARGGHYEFYGYKEFANRLFVVTRAGAAAKFNLQNLYGRSDDSFGERLAEAVRRQFVVVDEGVLDALRHGLLICDEIHNVYNILEANNYGIAIQYALDTLGDEAPRAVFMSATPMTGSAAEVVDLLNLLIPRTLLPGGLALRRADFFTRSAAPVAAPAAPAALPEEAAALPEEAAALPEEIAESTFVVSQLREGALERIAHLAAGRVSFLLDADVGSYPKRLFIGEEMPGVPYLRLTPCVMSAFHARTLAREQAAAGARETAGLPPGAYTLYDMAFPNPEFAPDAAATDPESYGLYLSGETPARLERASEEWRVAAGVVVEKGGEIGVSSAHVISGPFLGPARVALYSAKGASLMEAILDVIRAGPGKIMVYHHRVRMSGVLTIGEALRMHGLADETSAPTDATICAVCGTARSAHSGAPTPAGAPTHAYTPARFVMAHSDVDRAVMLRSMARYNAQSNDAGYEFRVLVGSRIIREGHNFWSVRHLLVASLPTDFPTLIQVFGRVVRKDSHNRLPENQRDVQIRVFVSTYPDRRTSPELQRYVDKGREYLVIQEVERALRVNAVDGFVNYLRVRTALHTGPGGELRQSLDALPYSPLVGPAARPGPPGAVTYEAYGHGEKEVATLAAVCRALFQARPVWTYEDLWEVVRAGVVRGVNYDPALFDEGNFALALRGLARPFGDPPTVVTAAGRFYIHSAARPDGRAALDVESYLRSTPAPSKVTVRVSDYLRGAKSGQNFAVRLREYENTYLLGDRPLELTLVEYGASFHYALLRRLVLAAGGRVTRDDARVCGLYRRYRIAVTAADAAAPAAARVYRGPPRPPKAGLAETLVGFLTPESVLLCGPGEVWYNVPFADFSVGRRRRENAIVVGFVVSVGEAPRADVAEPFAAASAEARFKIRPPVQRLRAAGTGDVRTLARGAVCETRPRGELEAYARRLRAAAGARGHARDARDARDAPRAHSAGELCDTIRLLLLSLEAAARAPAGGMLDGTRWVYLFHDRPPTISALGAPEAGDAPAPTDDPPAPADAGRP